MHEILQTLVRILVPVMPHQAEDIWQNTPECQKDGMISILLSDWPKAKTEWENEELDSEFSKLLKEEKLLQKQLNL